MQFELNEVKLQNTTLEKQLKKCHDDIVYLKGYFRRENLIFDGVAEYPDKNILAKIYEILGRIGICNCMDMKIHYCKVYVVSR